MSGGTVLLLGSTGWIGSQMVSILGGFDYRVVASKQRLDDLAFDVFRTEVTTHKPVAVLNCAGLTGRPNVDWCESHRHEVIRVNLLGTLALMEACEAAGLHLVNLATGCIFGYDPEGHPEPFTEADAPNFDGSFYSLTKGMVDRLADNYEHVLTLRLRMPISCDGNPRCFVTKIASYERVVDIPNSMSVLHTLLPLIPRMIGLRVTGRLNFVNPGAISHNQILDMYRAYLDPTFTYENFSEADQAKILKAGRSNNTLDTGRIEALFPGELLPIHDAVEDAFKREAARLLAK